MRDPETLAENLKETLEGFSKSFYNLADRLRAAEKEIDDMFIKRAVKAAEKAD